MIEQICLDAIKYQELICYASPQKHRCLQAEDKAREVCYTSYLKILEELENAK